MNAGLIKAGQIVTINGLQREVAANDKILYDFGFYTRLTFVDGFIYEIASHAIIEVVA
jgi:hypothetical protein